jgi:hypothetical protein
VRLGLVPAAELAAVHRPAGADLPLLLFELGRVLGSLVADLLDQEEWEISTRWAVYSGQFGSRDEAEAHRQELTGLGITPSFWKHVTRRD